MTMTETGHLDDFFRVHSSDNVMVNMLSLAEVEDVYKIRYLPGEGFVVHLHDIDILFACIGKLYVAKWSDIIREAHSFVTTQETQSMYTKADVRCAKQAYELASTSVYPSVSELINIAEDGNILGGPGITRADIKRAYELYGEPVTNERGEMTKKKVTCVQFSEEMKSVDKNQVVYADVMKIDGQKSLISLCTPLQLILCTG